MSNLKPCPWDKPGEVHDLSCDTTLPNGSVYHVTCHRYGCPGNVYSLDLSYPTKEQAIEAWNSRSGDSGEEEWRSNYETEISSLKRELGKLRRELHMRRARDKGEFWLWLDDDDNDLESLTGPILIQASSLKRLIIDAVIRPHKTEDSDE